MKKFIFFLALTAITIITSSGFNENRFGVRPGEKAPLIEITDSTEKNATINYKNKYTLINVWKSDDATSRTREKKYQAWLDKETLKTEAAIVSINLDENTTLFKSIVMSDGLEMERQHNLRGPEADKLRKKLEMTNAIGSLLIAPDGKVIAVNPKIADLQEILS